MADLPELLCPAGSREAALAALCNGADALYLGASAFGARATAGFDRDSLREIIDLCHAYALRAVHEHLGFDAGGGDRADGVDAAFAGQHHTAHAQTL